MDARKQQLSSHMHAVSSSLDDWGQHTGAVTRREANILKAHEHLAQETAEIKRATAPLEQVTTLQRVVSWLEQKVGTLEYRHQKFKLQTSALVQKVKSTAAQLEEHTINIRSVVPRLFYCEQTLQTALRRITSLEHSCATPTADDPAVSAHNPAGFPNDPPSSQSYSGGKGCCSWCASDFLC